MPRSAVEVPSNLSKWPRTPFEVPPNPRFTKNRPFPVDGPPAIVRYSRITTPSRFPDLGEGQVADANGSLTHRNERPRLDAESYSDLALRALQVRV